MFSELVESGSHRAETGRKGKFFLATLTFYGLLLVATGVGSIYAYNVRVEDRAGYELIALVKFEETRNDERSAGPARRAPTRSAAAAPSLNTRPTKAPEVAHDHPNLRDRPVASEGTPVLSPSLPVEIGSSRDIPTGIGGPVGPIDGLTRGSTGGPAGPVVAEPSEPPPPNVRPTPAPTPRQDSQPISLPTAVISGKAIEKPAPPYPQPAILMKIQGKVPVQILVDEQGRVVSAKATGGHVLLQTAAVQAAYRARFEPTRVSGYPVKVTGIITYNFVLQN